MFTGLVEAVGELVERTADERRLPASHRDRRWRRELAPGDSVAVNGVCLTVVLAGRRKFTPTSARRRVRVTTLGSLPRGSRVNLERPLRADGRLGGHFVQGHVDAIGHIEELRPDADFHWLTVELPVELAPYIVHKGSIAVDGISLTVAGLGADRFDVQIVPFTMEHTNLGRTQVRRSRQPGMRHGRQVRGARGGTGGLDADRRAAEGK